MAELLSRIPPCVSRGAMISTALGAGYTLLLLRLLPVGVMRAWFVLSALLTVFPASALLYLIDPLRYIGVPRRITQRICTFIMSTSFKLACWMNPQIRMKVSFEGNENAEGVPCTGWDKIGDTGIAFALNHTSFWDVFALIGTMPMSSLLNTRTLMKSSLRNIPVFGGCFDRVGHFPVYFKSDEDGNFQVDKEKQAAVQVGVDAHLSNGGNLAIFPEGAVNRHPEKLQTFRFGTFATIFEHKMPLYYVVAVGNEKTWPAADPYGGFPADIHIRIGAYPVDFAHKESRQVAGEMQTCMQKVYDDVLNEMKHQKKPKKKALGGAAAAAAVVDDVKLKAA